MRRVLSNGSFLRFYLLLGVALLVVFVIALAGRSFIEQVRREDYREQLASLPMSLMTQQLADLTEVQRNTLLARFSERLELQLSLQPISEAELGYFERSRLEQGKILVAESPWLLQQRLPGDTWLLQARLEDWSEHQWYGSIALLGDWLAAAPDDARENRIAQLRPGSWPLQLVSELPAGLSTQQQAQLASGSVITRLVSDNLSITLLYQLPGESQWLKAGPISRGDTLPPNLHLPLLVGLMIVLSLIIYLIMRSIEARMARLELAATRIWAGWVWRLTAWPIKCRASYGDSKR